MDPGPESETSVSAERGRPAEPNNGPSYEPGDNLKPLDVDGTRTVAIGSALWLLAFVLLLPFSGRLADEHRLWWLCTCLAGFGIGVFGWDYCRRRKRSHAVSDGRESSISGPQN